MEISEKQAILQIIYIANDFQNVWIKGSSFIIYYKGHAYIITAEHCIEREYLKNLYLSVVSSKKSIHNIPICNKISAYDSRGTRVQEDFCILVVDEEKLYRFLRNKAEFEDKSFYSSKILNTPLIKNMVRRIKNPIKRLKKIKATALYKKFMSKITADLENKMEQIDSSLVELKDLQLADDSFTFDKGKKCLVIGYSIKKGEMEYDDYAHFKRGKQYIMVLEGILTGQYNTNSGMFEILYDRDADLDGLSGAPVLCENRVIGVVSYVACNDKKLYFIPFEKIKVTLDWYMSQKK